jgi:hypothetical protein
LFFEKYIEEQVKEAFWFLRHPAPKLFSQLLSASGDVEYADMYLRQNKKVLLGQAKSKGIYSREKYSRSAIEFFKNDREGFYKDCGVDQLVMSISQLYNNPRGFEDKFPVGKRLEIFPVLVVNDRVLQGGFMSEMINQRFNELIDKSLYPNFIINPVVIIHISDIERLYEPIRTRKVEIWDLLRSNFTNNLLAEPFFVTLNRKQVSRVHPRKIIEHHIELVRNSEERENR